MDETLTGASAYRPRPIAGDLAGRHIVSVGVVDAGVTVSFVWSASGLVLGSRRLPEHVDLTRRELASVLFGAHPERPVDRPRALDWLPAFHLPIPILDRS